MMREKIIGGQRPRLLDLFCGAGGAAMGYNRAGFEVVGVDIKPQKRYPFEFVQGDALEYVAAHGREFDAIHASPPCQAFTAYRRAGNVRPALNLIPQTRAVLIASGKPYVIENVPGAPLINPVILCGSMFGLDVRRHRLFETTVTMLVPPCAHPTGPGKYPCSSDRENLRQTAEIGSWDISKEDQAAAIGIDWMTVPEMSQAIPPAYTEFIGRRLMEEVREAAAAQLTLAEAAP